MNMRFEMICLLICRILEGKGEMEESEEGRQYYSVSVLPFHLFIHFSNQFVLKSFGNRLGFRVDFEFSVNITDVGSNGILADE